VSIGAMVGPEAFMEVRYLAHAKQLQALGLIPEFAREFRSIFGRDSGGLVRPYCCDDAQTIVVAMGSVMGTIEDTIDAMRAQGVRIGALAVKSFRPFPLAEVREALQHAQRVVVLEKALAVGIGGILAMNVRSALSHIPLKGYTVIAGLGGRPITRASLERLFTEAHGDRLDHLSFLDLDRAAVDRVLERERTTRRSGPIAESLLRDLGVVAARL
jgi:pyruvate ferredoxin oxidoreductase alpha subunit